MSDELRWMTATEIATRVRRGDLSPVEIVDACLQHIDERNHLTNSFVLVLHEEARQKAREAEQALRSGAALGPLHGVPIAIKDLFDFKAGVRNTMGSRAFKDFVPQQTSAYIERIEQAGAIVVGKTNTPEFGHKGVTDNHLFGPTSTPFKPGNNAGGSSGGSAAAVGAGLVPFAQGSDGGGSIRIPASFSGVYGMKASFGRVPNVMRPNAFLSHTPFIHAGPLSRTVEDGALLLSVMAGPHPRDPFMLPDEGIDYVAATRRSIRGMKIAFSPNLDVFPVDSRVASVVADAVKAFEAAGAQVEEVKLGINRTALELANLWIRQISVLSQGMHRSFAEMGVDLAGEHRHLLTPQYRKLVDTCLGVSAVDYNQDQLMRTEVDDAVQNVLDDYDFLVSPTLAVPPVANTDDGNTAGPTEINGEEVESNIGWCLTFPINYTGNPAASVPAGLTAEGLPIGMQIIGRRFADDSVLAASAAFERVKPWNDTYAQVRAIPA